MENEILIRLAAFIGLFAVFAVIEAWLPRRQRVQSRPKRWLANWGLVLTSLWLLLAGAVLIMD